MLARLVIDIAARVSWSTLSPRVVALIGLRVRRHTQCIERIAARVRAGTYRPRSYRPRRPASAPGAPAQPDGAQPDGAQPDGARPGRARRPSPSTRSPWPPELLPATFGWLLPFLMPGQIGIRSGLQDILRDPEMIALIEAAPVSLSRPLRSLCWMLGLRPPPILAPRPGRAARPGLAAAASPEAGPPRSPPQAAPPPSSPPPRRRAAAEPKPAGARAPPKPA